MRFLHLADIHLDTAFGARSEHVRSTLRSASRTGLGRALDLAVDRRLDAVLIAGDLVDGERVSVQTERFLCESFSRAGRAGVDIIYATGNHDPADTELIEVLRREGLARVVSSGEPERLMVARDGHPIGSVTAAGHENRHVTEDLSARFRRPDSTGAEIALLHAQVVSARESEGHDPYAPAMLSTLRSSGFDYWALGHVHVRQALSERPAVHYAGNTQGRDPRESGAKGGLCVTIDTARPGGDRATVDFVELAEVRWETLVLDYIAGLERLADLADAIERQWDQDRESDQGLPGARWMLRVRLAGPTRLRQTLASTEAEEELGEALVDSMDLLDLELDVAGTRPFEPVSSHVDRPDVLGEILRFASELSTPGSNPTEVLGLDRDELAGAEGLDRGALDDYVRTLLEDADTALLDAILDRSGT